MALGLGLVALGLGLVAGNDASELSPGVPSENDAIWEQIKPKDTHNIIHHFGEGVKVAIIDTGLDLNHEGLQGFLAPSSEWKDFIDGDNLPSRGCTQSDGDSSYGHGTAIAGIIMQVAPKATIFAHIRVLDADGLGDVVQCGFSH
ncbi:MAG: S8 family serine peptidase [Deinococcales bacterium]